MYSPIGAISAFGSHVGEGLEAGMSLYDKYTDMQGKGMAAALMKELGLQNLGPMGGSTGAFPGMGMGQPTQQGPGASPGPSMVAGRDINPDVSGGLGGNLAAGIPSALAFSGQPNMGPMGAMALQGGLPPMPGAGGPMQLMPGQGQAQPVPTTSFRPGGPAGGMPTAAAPAPVQTAALTPEDMPTRDVGTVRPGELTPPRPGGGGGEPTPGVEPSLPPQIGIPRYAQTGQGWLSQPDLMKRIEAQFPNASPMAKFKALQAAQGMLNAGGKDSFNQTMRVMEFLQKQKQFEATQKKAADTEKARLDRLHLQEFKSDPERLELQPSLVMIGKRDATVREFTNTAVRMGEETLRLGNKIHASGIPVFQAWVNAGRRATGDPDIAAFDMQVHGFKSEIAKILGGSPTAAVLTEGARKEAAHFVPENATVQQITGVVNQFKRDAKIRAEEVEKQRQKILKRLDVIQKSYMAGKGAPDREALEITDPLASGGADPHADFRARAKAAGYSDAEIEEFIKKQGSK